MVAELLQKYVWLIQTFIRAGGRGIDLKELSERWERRFGAPYPRRSFNNHREVIESTFGIRIECDRSTSRYFIRYPDDVSDEDATASWLINTFTVNSLLSLGRERLSGRVSVEEIPSGQRYLTVIQKALGKKVKGEELVAFCRFIAKQCELTLHKKSIISKGRLLAWLADHDNVIAPQFTELLDQWISDYFGK